MGAFQVRDNTWDGDLFSFQEMTEVERNRIRAFRVTIEVEGEGDSASGDSVLYGLLQL
jgi:hypothetical protein